MGIQGVSLSIVKDYVSQYDHKDPKAIWKIGALDSDIYDIIMGYDNAMKIASDTVRFGLKGFENFTDEFGKEVKFTQVSKAVGPYNHKVIADNIMKILPPQLKSELAAEILKMSKISEDEEKN